MHFLIRCISVVSEYHENAFVLFTEFKFNIWEITHANLVMFFVDFEYLPKREDSLFIQTHFPPIYQNLNLSKPILSILNYNQYCHRSEKVSKTCLFFFRAHHQPLYDVYFNLD